MLLLLILLSAFVISAGRNESPEYIRINFVVQNPKYYANSMSYFKITGMRDVLLQKRANDTLQKWFYEPTGFFKPGKNIPKPFDHRKVEKEESMWLYRLMCQFHGDTLESIIFNDKDSVKLLGPSGYKGSGQSTCTWSAAVYRNHLLVISLEYDQAKLRDSIEDPLFLDLRTLQRPGMKVDVVFPQNKNAEMRSYMKNKIEAEFIRQHFYRKVVVTPNLQDSVITISSWQILGYISGYDVQLSFPYTLDGITSDGKPILLDQYFIFTLKELSTFTDEKYADKIEEILK